MQGQRGFWDVEDRLKELSAEGDPLERLTKTVNFEIFRPALVEALGRSDPSKGGRPGFDPVLKFKMLVLGAMHGLSLQQTDFLVRDRLSWMRFFGLGPGDTVPDANTLWDFREALIAAKALDGLFTQLDRVITDAGYLPMAGQIVEATLVAAPRQTAMARRPRSKRGHSQGVEGQTRQAAPEGSRRALDSEVLQSQDRRGRRRASARNAVPHFGYKNHISIDRRYGVIQRQKVMMAPDCARG